MTPGAGGATGDEELEGTAELAADDVLHETAQMEGLEEEHPTVRAQGVVDFGRHLLQEERDGHHDGRLVAFEIGVERTEASNELQARLEIERKQHVGRDGEGVEKRQYNEEAVAGAQHLD